MPPSLFAFIYLFSKPLDIVIFFSYTVNVSVKDALTGCSLRRRLALTDMHVHQELTDLPYLVYRVADPDPENSFALREPHMCAAFDCPTEAVRYVNRKTEVFEGLYTYTIIFDDDLIVRDPDIH